MLSRRGFLKTAAGLIVAAGAGELLLPERRVWALGAMPGPKPVNYDLIKQVSDWCDWINPDKDANAITPEDPFGRMVHEAVLREKKRLEDAVWENRGTFVAWLNEHPSFVQAGVVVPNE